MVELKVKRFKRPVFVDEESPLTPVFKLNTGRAFLSFYLVGSFTYIAYQVYLYSTDGGKSWEQDWSIVANGFRNLDKVIYIWLTYHAMTLFVVYPLTMYLRKCKTFLKVASWTIFVTLLGLTAYMCISVDNIGIASKMVLACETIRIGMKIVSFMVEVPQLTTEQLSELTEAKNCNFENNKSVNDDGLTKPVATFGHLIYFLFCPSALYSNCYPMRNERNWPRFFLLNYISLTICIMAVKLAQLILLPSSFGREAVALSLLINRLFLMSVVYSWFTLIAVGLFWQHCWLNAWAELLRFGDRRFYSDYYATADVSTLFRKWNMVIQVWLYRYIFCELAPFFDRTVTSILVLSCSGIFHDYLVFAASGCFLPIYVFSFPFAVLFAKMTATDAAGLRPFLLLASSNLTQGALHFVFVLEAYSRKNCPTDQEYSLASIVTPRFPSCLTIDMSS